MISVLGLEKTLAAAIRSWTKDYRLKTGHKDANGDPFTGPPSVFQGFVPRHMTGESNPDNPPDFPHVVVQAVKGRYSAQEAHCGVNILIGCWDDDEDHQGYQDAINIAENIVRNCKKYTPINNQYAMTDPAEWNMYYDKDLIPVFMCHLETHWMITTPIQRTEGIGWGLVGGEFGAPNPKISKGFPKGIQGFLDGE